MNPSTLALFDRAAAARGWAGLVVIRTFDRALTVDAVSDLIRRHRTPGVTVAGDFVVKHRRATDARDWMRGLAADPAAGLRGGCAEAINTLAANLFGAPSHRLLAHARSAATGRTWCVFEKLSGMHSLAAGVAQSGPELAETFAQVASALARGLQCGLFHGDANASNILLDGRGGVKLIDYEVAVAFSAPVGLGLALQFSKMWDERLKRVFDHRQFCDIVRRQLTAFSAPSELERNFGRFLHFSESRNNSARRRERLLEASGGAPDFSDKLKCVLAARAPGP